MKDLPLDQKVELSKLLNQIRSELHGFYQRHGLKIRLIHMEWERDKSGEYSVARMRAERHEDAGVNRNERRTS